MYGVHMVSLLGWETQWRCTESVCKAEDILYTILFLNIFGKVFLGPMHFLFSIIRLNILLNIYDEFTTMLYEIILVLRTLTIE